MLQFHISKKKLATLFMMLIFAGTAVNAQKTKPKQPVWWFGESAAANFNFYRGTTQILNNDKTVPAAFHKGYGVKPYLSLLTEYRPNKVLGGMLNVAYDNRGGKFDGVKAPCNCAADLSTNISYVTVEPSLRLAPFSNAFYIFAGPTLSFNVSKAFTYTQEKQTDTRGDWSDIHKTVFSGQAGAGIDIPVSARTSPTQMTISPFVSFLTDFGHEPRSVESWSFYTIRAGIALKFGTSGKSIPAKRIVEDVISVPVIREKEVQFSVRAPKVVPLSRQVKETFPLINSVFFNQESTEIPARYIVLNQNQAVSFHEAELQEGQPDNLNNGRSARQLAVYHNILNIIGDRMRSNPQSTISLIGASAKNPAEGKIMAANVKQYLVSVFAIDGSRISTDGRDKPAISSEQPGADKELALLREEDRRVDIISTSPELLMQVGGTNLPFLKPVEIISTEADPLDSYVLFNTDGATNSLKSWSVDVIDEKGNVQQYGPYTQDQASVSGKTILGNSQQGNYKIIMLGETKNGDSVKKESSVSLMKMDDPKQEGLRYSILFNFDQSKSITSYQNFLTDIVTPLIPENAMVIIHGHTDIIGDAGYNHTLSQERTTEAQQIIEQALAKAGTKGVKFQSYGFGEDAGTAPFENTIPEERFYNRTVIIDIIPAK